MVLCDRYLDSSLAYQGYGRGLGTDDIITLNVWATECLFPDLTLFLDLDDSTPRRAGWPRCPTVWRRRTRTFTGGWPRASGSLLVEHPHRIRRVDARGSESEVQERVRAVVEEELELFSH